MKSLDGKTAVVARANPEQTGKIQTQLMAILLASALATLASAPKPLNLSAIASGSFQPDWNC
jgi:hypothetical protein